MIRTPFDVIHATVDWRSCSETGFATYRLAPGAMSAIVSATAVPCSVKSSQLRTVDAYSPTSR
jgi:hypothetical protein